MNLDLIDKAYFFPVQYFQWKRKEDDIIGLLINHRTFTENIGVCFGLVNAKLKPLTTPYCYVRPNNSLPLTQDYNLYLKRFTTVYQHSIVILNWLSICNHPNLSLVVSFLARLCRIPRRDTTTKTYKDLCSL